MALTILCSSCGCASPAGFRFCGTCGARLDAPVPPPASAAQATPAPGGAERRQLTVMFCDLADSTALAERIDAEELREVIRSFQSAVQKAVDRYGGTIAQYLGDGVLVYFGFPEAHEDDARRAVHAALGVLGGVRELAGRTPVGEEPAVAVRIGIHTGPVVAGEVGAGDRRESLAVGATPNIAARMQSLAEPGTIVISAATRRLAGDVFAYEPLGEKHVKGVSKAIEVCRVAGVRSTSDAPAGDDRSMVTPPVGRRRELDVLLDALASARGGKGRVVQVRGGSGVGKSRLLRMFREEAGDTVQGWLLAACSPYEESSAFSALTRPLRHCLGVPAAASDAGRLDQLDAALAELGLPVGEAAPLFADLLSIAGDGRHAPIALMFNKRQERTIQLLVDAFLGYGRARQTVLLVEDVHWSDPSTRQFLQALVAAVPSTSLVVVLTFRPVFEPAWGAGPHIADIALDHLSDDDARQLVVGLLGSVPHTPQQVAQIVAKADGVPLYLEEITRMLLESGQLGAASQGVAGGALEALDIPETLQGSLTARLDRLGDAKELAQLGAVLGREFSHDLLSAAWPHGDESFARLVPKLVESGLVFHRDEQSARSYVYKHALIRDAAYESLLKAARQQHHRRVAEVLVAQFADVADRSPELLANHYEGAALAPQAIAAWCAASRRAFWKSAFLEAIQHCRRALALLPQVAAADRARHEVEILVTLGPALTATTGYAGPDVGPTYSRALELCGQMEEAPNLFWVLWGIGSYYFNRAVFQKSYDCGQQMQQIARAQGDNSLLCEALFGLGVNSTLRGNVAEATKVLEQGIALNGPDRDRRFTALTGIDNGVATLSFGALAATLRGERSRADELIAAAIAESRRLEHPFSLAWALTHAVFMHSFRGEHDQVRQYAAEGLPLCEQRGIVIFMPLMAFCVGVADGGPAGLEQMTGMLGFWRAIGSDVWQTYFLARIAEWHVANGDAVRGREVTEEAIEAAERTGERIWYPALLCQRGDLATNPADARRAYQAALDAARAQGAAMFEERAQAGLRAQA